MKVINLVSMSGGKDSTATLLKAIESGVKNIVGVFADTGHEHEETYRYIDYIEQKLDIKVVRIRPDFSKQIMKKRKYVENNWQSDLEKGKHGDWKRKKKTPLCFREPQWIPVNPFGYYETQYFEFNGGRAPLTSEQAKHRVKEVLEDLYPTGNPFLDLCKWKGRFPSSKARFCTEELKKKPIMEYQESLLEEYDRIVVWVGVRRDESASRAKIESEWECEFGDQLSDHETSEGIWLYRPILDWTVDDVFDCHRKHGIEPNPLYKIGMGRVGCMPCVMCRKDELKQIGLRCSSEVDRVEKWELEVAKVSKRGNSTLFHVGQIHGISDNNLISTEKHGIRSAVEWAKTSRGGRQFNMFDDLEESKSCTSVYGLCE